MSASVSVSVNRRRKPATKEDLQALAKEELVDRVLQLEAQVLQLKNIVKKITAPNDSAPSGAGRRKFDFTKCHKRHVLLRFYYLGWDYQGFAAQENSAQTIEHHLFSALQKTCLIESRETSNYHRCGRTDKGVSAFSQVISIDLRSKFAADTQMTDASIRNEINYCEILNRVLPKEIRCTAWQPLYSRAYSARFDCRVRTYRYFLPRSNLDIDSMRTACGYLVGAHDFRNLCKMDVANGVVKFERELYEVKIVPAHGCDERIAATDPYAMLYVQLTGKAFLWHQVRAIVAVLLLIGQGKERPEVVQELLDVAANPCTPQYSLASDVPLNLFNVEMETATKSDVAGDERPAETIGWIYDAFTLARVISTLQQQWTKISVRSQMTMEMLQVLEGVYETTCKGERIFDHTLAVQDGAQPKRYQPLMARSKCSSLEHRIEHYAKKRRIEVVNGKVEKIAKKAIQDDVNQNR